MRIQRRCKTCLGSGLRMSPWEWWAEHLIYDGEILWKMDDLTHTPVPYAKPKSEITREDVLNDIQAQKYLEGLKRAVYGDEY